MMLSGARGVFWWGLSFIALLWLASAIWFSIGIAGPTDWEAATCYAGKPVASAVQAVLAVVGLALLARAAFAAKREAGTQGWLLGGAALLAVWVAFVVLAAPGVEEVRLRECFPGTPYLDGW